MKPFADMHRDRLHLRRQLFSLSRLFLFVFGFSMVLICMPNSAIFSAFAPLNNFPPFIAEGGARNLKALALHQIDFLFLFLLVPGLRLFSCHPVVYATYVTLSLFAHAQAFCFDVHDEHDKFGIRRPPCYLTAHNI